MLKSTVFILASLLATRAATADELASSHATRDLPTVAITVSPIHLLIPMAEVTTEIRIADKVGVAVIAGIGTYHQPDTNMRVSLYEGGVSARYYVTGSFRSGLQLGAEAIYIKAATSSTTVEVRAAGLGLSPFAGYKWTHRSGFTLEGQAGATFMAARAHGDNGQMTASTKTSAVGPMLNLQVGYSF